MMGRICVLLFVAMCAALAGCGGGGSPLPAAQAEPPPTERPLILAFGDSITAGYMPVDGVHQLRQDLSYVESLKAVGPVITAAVGGAASDHGINAQAYWLRGLPARAVVVMFGINDAIYGLTPEATVDNIGKIFAAYPGAVRVVLAPPLWSDATRTFQAELTARLQVQALVWGAAFVDLYTPSADLRAWCTADRHPCADWHRATGERVALAVRAKLTEVRQ